VPNPLLEWFDRIETTLSSDAHLAGLFEHAGTVGQAREIVVRDILKRILPPSVHIGTGMIFDYAGNKSKQIDVVLYDPRFPILEMNGIGQYFVEGVLAAIEVKSTITTAELHRALTNGKSVLDLGIKGEHPDEAEKQIAFYRNFYRCSAAEARDLFRYRIHPATYLFGFRSELSLETCAQSTLSWWTEAGYANTPYFPALPRLLVAGDIVGLANDGRLNLNTNTGDNRRHTMALFATAKRFRWFAFHIMDQVSGRLGIRNMAENFTYRLSDHFPWEQYVREIADTKAILIRDPRIA
jgi:hypothetical protein